MAQADNWSTVRQLFGGDASGVSIHKSRGADPLSNCRSVAWNCQLPVLCSLRILGGIWGDADRRDEHEFSRDRGGLVCSRGVERTYRSVECWVDPNPSDYGAAGESAGNVARTESGAD